MSVNKVCTQGQDNEVAARTKAGADTAAAVSQKAEKAEAAAAEYAEFQRRSYLVDILVTLWFIYFAFRLLSGCIWVMFTPIYVCVMFPPLLIHACRPHKHVEVVLYAWACLWGSARRSKWPI